MRAGQRSNYGRKGKEKVKAMKGGNGIAGHIWP